MKNTITAFVTLLALSILIIQFVGCGPSKMEIEEHARKGEVFDFSTGKFVKEKTTNPYEEHQEEPTQPSMEEIHYDDIEIRVIDSCEYIVWTERGDAGGNIIHKANCRNPIHHN